MTGAGGKAILYRRAYHPDGRRLDGIGILADGTLRNPHGYPETDVREAIAAAEERRRAKRSTAAKKAAGTRARRRDMQFQDVLQRLRSGAFKPGDRCAICGRKLTDAASQERGVGPECWGDVVAALEGLQP